MPKYSSFAAFAAQQLKNIADATDANKVLRIAAVTIVPKLKRRVQNEGKKADGTQIGQYGDKVIPQAFGKAQTFASKKRLKKVTGQDGYKTLRQKLGLQVESKDYTFSGDMMRSFVAGPTGPNSYGLGFRSDEEFKKAMANEKRDGNVFSLSKFETDLSLSTINKEAQKYLSR